MGRRYGSLCCISCKGADKKEVTEMTAGAKENKKDGKNVENNEKLRTGRLRRRSANFDFWHYHL